MAYPTITGELPPSEKAIRDFLLDVGSRKEFRALAPLGALDPAPVHHRPYGFGGRHDDGVSVGLGGLRFHGAQLFAANFANPDTPYTRLLLNWQTGTGKTNAAVLVTLGFARHYAARAGVPLADRPTVTFIGFTKGIIQAEMLRHPEFGFVTPAEIAELARLRSLAEASGSSSSPESRQMAGYAGVLKRRITDKTRGGYYRFAGYKEFANHLFAVTEEGSSRGFSVADLYRVPEGAPGEEGGTFLARIDAAVAAGDVVVNRELLDSLRGGFIVGDEIHDTYNAQAKNNYGVAIQYALDKLEEEDPATAPRALFMSATITGGRAPEIVDALNFLIPARALKKRLRREDFFRTVARPDGRRLTRLLPGALDRIGRLSAGRVSFLIDSDEGGAYPRRTFEGVPLPDPAGGGDIPYLRFVPCPMAPFHERTLERALRERQKGKEKKRNTVPSGGRTLYDMVYPNPAFAPDAAAADPEAHGLYDSAETPQLLAGAPADWRRAAGVRVESLKGGGGVRAGDAALISGDFLSVAEGADPPGVEFYSTKYSRIGKDIVEIVEAGRPGKIFVFHPRVRMSGALQIQELLDANGFIDADSTPSASTRCSRCGARKKGHAPKDHRYAPARYLTVHSEIDRGAVDRAIARFNAPPNVAGADFRVLIGSRIVRQGVNFMAVAWELVASVPVDIPTLVQVFGRVVRRGSHAALPEEDRNVSIRLYVSTAGPHSKGKGPAPELTRYAEKMEEYGPTQEVERAVRRYAVDAFANYSRVKARSPGAFTEATIDSLPYTPVVGLDDVLRLPENTVTFEAYGHGDREVAVIRDSVRALFEAQPVWTYGDLWAAVRSGRVEGVAEFPGGFSEESFALALSDLAGYDPAVARPSSAGAFGVSRVGAFYVRSPRDAEGRPLLDVESYVRDPAPLEPLRVSVGDYVRSARAAKNFKVQLREFEDTFGPEGPPATDAFLRYDAPFHYSLLRALVADAGASKKAKDPQGALGRMAGAYRRFRILLTEGDIAAAPEALRLVRGKKKPRAKSSALVGYAGPSSVSLWGGGAAGWYEIPRAAVGYGKRYLENPSVVGYVERRGPHLRFKIRQPLHELAKADVRDVRSLARGAACETRPRAELEEVVRQLGGRGLGNRPSSEACREIWALLLEREEKARKPARGMGEGVRWLYLFNDRLPSVTLGV